MHITRSGRGIAPITVGRFIHIIPVKNLIAAGRIPCFNLKGFIVIIAVGGFKFKIGFSPHQIGEFQPRITTIDIRGTEIAGHKGYGKPGGRAVGQVGHFFHAAQHTARGRCPVVGRGAFHLTVIDKKHHLQIGRGMGIEF